VDHDEPLKSRSRRTRGPVSTRLLCDIEGNTVRLYSGVINNYVSE